jgi:thioredoxin reductase (NADPH)
MYDVIIIGAGPGGLTAGIYAQRAMLKTLLIESLGVGGQIAKSDVIENYPGFKSISGMDLMKRFEEQAVGLGLEIRFAEVTNITDKRGHLEIDTSEGQLHAKTVIIASGASYKHLGIPGEAEFIGRGVSFCATCDAFFFKDREVAVIGGGDTALKEGLFLTQIVKKVHIVHRRDKFRGEKLNQDKLQKSDKVEFHLNKIPVEVVGDPMGVTGIKLKDSVTGQESTLNVDGVFVFAGVKPNSGFIEADKDEFGFIKTDSLMQTSIEGVYAIGDCRVTPLRQVATAVGDGALAAVEAERLIESRK